MLEQVARVEAPAGHLTRLGLGTWELSGPSHYGWGPVDEADSVAVIRHVLSSGINWIDTAPFYGRGHAEEVVGRAIQPWIETGDVIVSTKCGLRWDPASHRNTPPTNNLRPESIRYECEQSLRRLGVERIDLYQFHWPDELGTPIEESWGTMGELVDEGKVRWAGLSNFGLDDLELCSRIRPVDCLQPPLNLLDRRARKELIPWCRDHGTAVIAYSPMASGLLTGSFTRAVARSLPDDDWRRHAPQFQEPAISSSLELVEAIRPIAERLDISLPALAIAWALSVPGVTAAIVGAKKPGECEDWIEVPDVDLDPIVLDELAEAIRATGAGIE